MNAKERFAAVCNHQAPDRVPIDYLAGRAIDKKLRSYLGVDSEEELLNELCCDFYYLSVRDISQNESSLKIYRGPELDITETERTCPFGIRYLRAQYDWKFGADEAIGGALYNAESVKDILNHPWPKPEWFDVEALAEECSRNKDRVIISGFWTAIMGNAYRLLGFERFLMSMALNPEMIRTLIRRISDFYMALNDRLFSALKGKIDVFFFGNDFGSQNGLLFSEEMWLDFFLEAYIRIIALAHCYGLKVMVHSCGSIASILKHLIKTGADIIDPVQITAKGMAPERLKQEFGEELVFHGAIDTQKLLPSATAERVYQQTLDMIRILGEKRGYIVAPCNNLQDDTPVKNIEAMYRAAKNYLS